MAKIKPKIPLIYIFLYSKFKDRSFGNIYLGSDIVMKVLRNVLFHVPGHNFRHIVLKELEEYGLIKRIHRMKYQLIDSKCDEAFKNLEIKPLPQDDFEKIINHINKQKKIKCYDASVYKLIPSDCLKRLENLNVWILD